MAKKSLRDRMKERRENLKTGDFTFFIFKEGTTRMRHVPVGEDVEPIMEVLYVYMNKELGGFISPATFGKKCAFQKAFEELKNSKKSSDKEFAPKVQPKRKWVSLAYRYKDEKGTEVDEGNGVKLALLNKTQYEDMLDIYLDESGDGGDFTHPKEGFDLKHKRTGSGKFDTKYKVTAANPIPKKCHPAYKGPYDLEAEVKKVIPTYEETKTMLEKFLSLAPEEDDSDSKPSKKDRDVKKKKKRDI